MREAADAPDPLLDCPAGGKATLDQPVARFNDVIGYKLLELIRGGWVRRGVHGRANVPSAALKVLKPKWTPQVVPLRGRA